MKLEGLRRLLISQPWPKDTERGIIKRIKELEQSECPHNDVEDFHCLDCGKDMMENMFSQAQWLIAGE